MSLVQWSKLIPYFATVVLLVLILLLQLTKQSKAPAERQTTVKSRKKQTECCYDCTAPILHNYFHITHKQTSFAAISLQKAQFSVCISTPLSLNEFIVMKTSKYFNLNVKRLNLKIFT